MNFQNLHVHHNLLRINFSFAVVGGDPITIICICDFNPLPSPAVDTVKLKRDLRATFMSGRSLQFFDHFFATSIGSL